MSWKLSLHTSHAETRGLLDLKILVMPLGKLPVLVLSSLNLTALLHQKRVYTKAATPQQNTFANLNTVDILAQSMYLPSSCRLTSQIQSVRLHWFMLRQQQTMLL